MYAVMIEISGGSVSFPFRDQPTVKDAKAKMELLIDGDLLEMGKNRHHVTRLSRNSVAMPGQIVSVVEQTEEMTAEWKRVDDERYLDRKHEEETDRHYVGKHGQDGNATVPDCMDCRVHLLNAMKAPAGDHWHRVYVEDLGDVVHQGTGPKAECAWCDLEDWSKQRDAAWLAGRETK